MTREKYLFDANPFITAKNTFYIFDIAPTFWAKLNELAEREIFGIIDRVYDELVRHPGSIQESKGGSETKLFASSFYFSPGYFTATTTASFSTVSM